MKKLVAVVAMSGAMMFGFASTAQSAPTAPRVVGMSKSEALSKLRAAGVNVKVDQTGIDNNKRSCTVRSQYSFLDYEFDKKEKKSVPITTTRIKVHCKKNA